MHAIICKVQGGYPDSVLGPFDTDDAAHEYADLCQPGDDWLIVSMTEPDLDHLAEMRAERDAETRPEDGKVVATVNGVGTEWSVAYAPEHRQPDLPTFTRYDVFVASGPASRRFKETLSWGEAFDCVRDEVAKEIREATDTGPVD